MTARSNAGDYATGIFYPYICDITAISSEGFETLVTTSIDHMFSIGNLVSFVIPPQYGMRKLNRLKGYITEIPEADQILVAVDTSNFDPFVIPTVTPPAVIDPAQVQPVGDANTGYQSSTGTTLEGFPGAFNVTMFP